MNIDKTVTTVTVKNGKFSIEVQKSEGFQA